MTGEHHLSFDQYDQWISITDNTLFELAESIDVMVTWMYENVIRINENSSAATDKRSEDADAGNTKTTISVLEELLEKVENVKRKKDFVVCSVATVLCKAKEELNRQVLYLPDSVSGEIAPFHIIKLDRYAEETCAKFSQSKKPCLKINTKKYPPPTDGEIHSPSTEGEIHSPSTEGKIHSSSTDGEIHSPPTDSEIHSPPSCSEIHSPSTDGEIHSPPTDSEIHSPSTDGEIHSPSTEGEIHYIQDACVPAKTHESETNVLGNVESIKDDGILMDQYPELKRNSADSDPDLSGSKCKTSMKVQIYSHLHESIFPEIEDELIRQLKENLKDTCASDTEFVIRKQKNDIQPEVTVFLLCLTSSRIGTDVANLLHGLKLTQEMIVIVFHHKDEYVLPSQASKRVLTDESYKYLGGIYDMAYLSIKGIYPCEMNEKSIKSLTNLIIQQQS